MAERLIIVSPKIYFEKKYVGGLQRIIFKKKDSRRT
jgi:hypothetical protein